MKLTEVSQAKVDELLDELVEEYNTPEELLGKEGLLNQLTKRLIERALQGELTHHLQQKPEHCETPVEHPAQRNSRNGHSKKTLHTDHGSLRLEIPRDRRSEFVPVLVPKGQRRLVGIDEKILALYAHGLSVRDIQFHLAELYGVEISPTLISQVTDEVSDEVQQWQSRPLERIYPILYLDALEVKIRHEGRVSNRAVYLALGVNLEGRKELLGIWIAQTEGAKFWLGVLTNLKNRGVQDVFIACVDGLTGFPEAIETVDPEARVQLCMVHLVRNSLRYVSWRQQRAVAADLRPIYQAATVQQAAAALDAFAQKWDKTYPAISPIWIRHWERIIPLFDYPPEIRRVIYTTNAIESLNRSLRKVLKTKGAFPDETSVFKLLYLALQNIAKKWTMPITNWKAALSRFAIEYPDRFLQ
jgi:transposase-like protein